MPPPAAHTRLAPPGTRAKGAMATPAGGCDTGNGRKKRTFALTEMARARGDSNYVLRMREGRGRLAAPHDLSGHGQVLHFLCFPRARE
eukprot:scaffold1041_cov124-Isochrysis_galbana.AAC.5